MIKEFICPNGRMSVNGVCPIFEGDDGQIKDMQEPVGKLQFDFELPTMSAFETADNIINSNIETYNDFVTNKLGMSKKTQDFKTFASMAYGLSQGGGVLSVLGPLAIPFIAGGALKNQQKKIVDRDLNIDAGIAASDNDDNMGYSAPATTSQGVTSAQHAAFRM
tara:strand:- start:123 stop:614 length:492 start_codon:yes stop_codon:yes gene_type:complete